MLIRAKVMGTRTVLTPGRHLALVVEPGEVFEWNDADPIPPWTEAVADPLVGEPPKEPAAKPTRAHKSPEPQPAKSEDRTVI